VGVKLALSTLPKAYLQFLNSRKDKVVFYPWFTAVGFLIASHGLPPLLPSVTIVVSMLVIASCVYTYNDVIDLEMDRLNPNKMNRPLPSGKVSVQEAMRIVYISGFIGVGLLFFTNLPTFLLCVTYMALFLAYSNPYIRFKKRFILKESTLAAGAFMMPLIGGIAVGSISPAVIFAATFISALAFTAGPAFNEQLDIEEDRKYGIKSLAVVLSWKAKMEMVIIFVLALMTLTPLTYTQLELNVIFPIVVVAVCLLVLRYLIPLLSVFEDANFRRARNALWALPVLVSMALILGSLQFVF